MAFRLQHMRRLERIFISTIYALAVNDKVAGVLNTNERSARRLKIFRSRWFLRRSRAYKFTE